MNKHLIIVEGLADAVFINDLIHIMNSSIQEKFIKLKNIKVKGIYKISENPLIKILIAGGCTTIELVKTQILEHQDQGYNILMIQDADDDVKDKVNGGFKKRMSYLDEIKKQHNLNFNTFLFPDHNNDGDLETILLSIVNEEKFAPFLSSYSSYTKEICTFSIQKHADELLENKNQVYGYCQVYTGMKLSSEKDRDYKSIYWDLASENLNSLKSFLKKELKI